MPYGFCLGHGLSQPLLQIAHFVLSYDGTNKEQGVCEDDSWKPVCQSLPLTYDFLARHKGGNYEEELLLFPGEMGSPANGKFAQTVPKKQSWACPWLGLLSLGQVKAS